MAFEIFQSARLVFRPLDAHPQWDETLHKLRSSASFWNGDIALPTPGGSTSAQEYHKILSQHCMLALYICLRRTPEERPVQGDWTEAKSDDDDGLVAIGILTLSKDGPESHSQHAQGSVGIEMIPAYQGKGYGGEALRWVQWYAFECARMHRLSVQCVEWNKGALRLYQKLNWKVEGVSREAVWFMGRWHGLVNLGLLEHEWREGDGKAQIGVEDMAKLMNCE